VVVVAVRAIPRFLVVTVVAVEYFRMMMRGNSIIAPKTSVYDHEIHLFSSEAAGVYSIRLGNTPRMTSAKMISWAAIESR